MAESLTFEALRIANLARCEERFHPVDEWSPCDWMTATAGELGECANLIKKLRQGRAVDMVSVGHELADTLVYLDLLCQRLGLNLGEEVRAKFNQDSVRYGASQRL